MTRKKSDVRKRKLTCPCCKGEVYDSEASQTLNRKVWLWGSVRPLECDDLRHTTLRWACDGCHSSGKAIHGNPEKQLYCDFDPYLAYFDIDKTCRKCKEEFAFRKEEQKYWYETLRFWVQSTPNNCVVCRKEIREERKLNSELSEILKEKEKLTLQDMERLSKIYEEVNKPGKSTYYKRLLQKEKRKNDAQPDDV